MECKTEDTKTRYQNIKIQNIKTILKYWTKPNLVLAEKTKLSIPTICNYKRQIRENVVDGKLLLNFEHGNTSNKNSKKISDNFVKKLFQKYFDLNEKIGANITNNFITIADFYKDLTKEEKSKISSSHLYKAFLKFGFCSYYAKHKTKRISKQIMKSILDKKEATKDQETMYLKNIKIIDKIKKLSIYSNEKSKYEFGQCMEIDAQFDRFFGTKEKVALYHAIDVKSGALLGFWCEKEETTQGYQKLLEIVFEKYGLPERIISDKRRTMWGSDSTETAFKNALKEKGIELFSSSNPKAKPNVERSNSTAQRNFPYFFNKENIKTIKDVQDNHEKITNFYNKKFNKKTFWKTNLFTKPGNENQKKMDLIINRKVSSGVVKFNNKYLCPFDKENKRVLLTNNCNVKLCQDSNGILNFIGNGKRYEAKEPKGNQLTPDIIFAWENKLDINIPGVNKVYKLVKNSKEIIDLQRQMFEAKITDDTNSEIVKWQQKIFKELEEINVAISKSIWFDLGD